MYQTVDLASKFSAVVVRDYKGEVLRQYDSRDLSALAFATKVAKTGEEFGCYTILEDLPYNNAFTQGMTKAVTRLQGVFIAVMHKQWDRVLFVEPSTWQRSFPGVARSPKGVSKAEGAKIRIEAARVHALDRGYTPPDLVSEYIASLPEGTRVLKKFTTPLEKNRTDYVDAFLMNVWASQYTFEELLDLSGVQRPSV
jgi:hypothetical protein